MANHAENVKRVNGTEEIIGEALAAAVLAMTLGTKDMEDMDTVDMEIKALEVETTVYIMEDQAMEEIKDSEVTITAAEDSKAKDSGDHLSNKHSNNLINLDNLSSSLMKKQKSQPPTF